MSDLFRNSSSASLAIRCASRGRNLVCTALVAITFSLAFMVVPVEHAQSPCCTIILIDAAKNLVTARNPETGLTFQFNVPAAELRALKLGHAVTADFANRTVTAAIKGVAKSYAAFDLFPIVPCCNVVSVQPDPFAPFDAIVTARNSATGKTFQFRLQGEKVKGEAVARSITAGQAVAADPTGTWAYVRISSLAVQSFSTYSFKIRSE